VTSLFGRIVVPTSNKKTGASISYYASLPVSWFSLSYINEHEISKCIW